VALSSCATSQVCRCHTPASCLSSRLSSRFHRLTPARTSHLPHPRHEPRCPKHRRPRQHPAAVTTGIVPTPVPVPVAAATLHVVQIQINLFFFSTPPSARPPTLHTLCPHTPESHAKTSTASPVRHTPLGGLIYTHLGRIVPGSTPSAASASLAPSMQ
jgi:hypothetical protein